MLGVAGFWASEWPRDGGGGGRKGEGEKEEMSMSQPRMEPKSERENEGNVCDRQTTSREGHLLIVKDLLPRHGKKNDAVEQHQ